MTTAPEFSRKRPDPSQKPKKESRTFGPIPGVRVLKIYDDRDSCYRAAVHGVIQGGIHGSSTEGAYSIVLSGGYDEDEDRGETFTYTGSGGRSAKGPEGPISATGWDSIQREDQSFDNKNNKSLQVSSENKRPVRVIRGFFKDRKDRKFDSPFAPVEGYRYDGLYIVENAYMRDGTQGFKVCAFDFRRMEGQPPIPFRGRRPK